MLLIDSPISQEKYQVEELDMLQMGMASPAGICIYNNDIYVCDAENHCIMRYDKKLEMIESYGTLGMEEGNFSRPRDITFADDSFYVLDSGNNRVQRFSSNFEFLEVYYLDSLLSEQGMGIYLSVAVDSAGVIYVSTFSPDINDAYIYTINNQEENKLGTNIIGYLCSSSEEVYFANMLEFHVEEHKYSAESGKNILYKVESNKVKEIARLEDKYVPVALTCWKDSIYVISAGVGYIHCYTLEDEEMTTVLSLPRASLHMYMAIDEEGNLYISDCENGIFYRAKGNL